MEKYKVLFLCTGNSCRSQMAEAIVNDRLSDTWEAVSAGTKPAGYVHPKAIQALSEIGIEHQGRSKLADEFHDVPFDQVVTVCDSAAEECPLWLGQGKRVHHSFPDPAQTDDLDDFRAVRDAIEKEIIELLELHHPATNRNSIFCIRTSKFPFHFTHIRRSKNGAVYQHRKTTLNAWTAT